MHVVQLLEVVRDADQARQARTVGRALGRAADAVRERPVVEAAAHAEPVAARIEAQQRHEHEMKRLARLEVARVGTVRRHIRHDDAEASGAQRRGLVERHEAHVGAGRDGQGGDRAERAGTGQHRIDGHLAAHGGVARDDGGARSGRGRGGPGEQGAQLVLEGVGDAGTRGGHDGGVQGGAGGGQSMSGGIAPRGAVIAVRTDRRACRGNQESVPTANAVSGWRP